MDIKFHCDESSNFQRADQTVRAFTYTDYFIEPHNHDFYEMNIVLGGRGYHRIEGATFAVKRGDVFVIPPMIVHSYDNTDDLEVYHILLKKDFVKRNEAEAVAMPGFLELMEIEPFLRQNCSEAMFLHLLPWQMDEIEQDLKFFEDGSVFCGSCFASLRDHTAWKLIYYFSYLLHQQIISEGKGVTAKYRNQILDTLEYLNSHFAEKITVCELAERVYLSRSTFLRSFSSVCGCSPTEYLTRYRVKKAEELLETSAMSKTEIAHSCGFYDLSHMERSIKKVK